MSISKSDIVVRISYVLWEQKQGNFTATLIYYHPPGYLS
jgi:hypothetical protein